MKVKYRIYRLTPLHQALPFSTVPDALYPLQDSTTPEFDTEEEAEDHMRDMHGNDFPVTIVKVYSRY